MVELRSSTSSSEGLGRFPWAALLALLAVVLFDAMLLGPMGPWPEILQRVGITNPASHFTARERVWLSSGSPAGKKAVIVLGTSRGMAGFSEPTMERENADLDVVKLARPGHLPFQMRSLIEELVVAKPNVVVLPISEFDTHRPIRIEPVAGRGTANFGAIVELLNAAGPGFVWSNRTTILRLFLASRLNGYRFRELLGLAGLSDLRRFERRGSSGPGARPMTLGGAPDVAAGQEPIAFWDGAVAPISEERLDTIAQQFDGPLGATVGTLQIPMIREITAGTHVPIQDQLIRSGVERLRDAGIEVVIVETPLHPVAAELYDTGLRSGFLELARELDAIPGVGFVSLDETGPFGDSDFGDLLHLNAAGQARLSEALLSRPSVSGGDDSSR